MNNQTKLEFRLVPTKGVASGKGCIIRGSNLTLPENDFSGIFCQVHADGDVWACAEAPILEKSDSEIRCA